MTLSIKHGLDIPLSGKPSGSLQQLQKPRQIALSLNPFEEIRFKILVKTGDAVKIGQPLVEHKGSPGLYFVSPAAGIVVEIRRGLKRRLLDVVIAVAEKEEHIEHEKILLDQISKEELLSYLLKGGAFPHIRMRPFDLLADPNHLPRDIFVKAVETAPYVPPAELQVEGEEDHFQVGLDALRLLTSGQVHLVYRKNSPCKAFTDARRVKKYSISGPHPSSHSSVHIHLINPIRDAHDIVWTLSALDVVIIGKLITTGKYPIGKVVSIAGDGIIEAKRGFFKIRAGFPISNLIEGRVTEEFSRLISGEPLTGTKVSQEDFIEFYHTAFCVIPENIQREPFHFLRLGLDKYSASRAYLSGHLPTSSKRYRFTTNQHGEERAFIDGSIYNKVMPMHIPTMQLIKAILAEDFELAQDLGLLEVCSEDFALPTFICPSKIEMMDIVKQGLHRYSKEMGY